MRVEFTPSRDDYVAFFVSIQEHDHDARVRRWWFWPFVSLFWLAAGILVIGLWSLVILILATWVIFAIRINDLRVAMSVTGVFALAGLVAWCVALPLLDWKKRRRQGYTKKMRRLVKRSLEYGVINTARRFQLSIDAEGLVVVESLDDNREGVVMTERKETRARWSAVSGIHAGDYGVLFELKINRRAWAAAPRTAFADNDAFRQFVEEARRLAASASEAAAVPNTAIMSRENASWAPPGA